MPKSSPISIRLSDDDQQFLTELDAGEAVTVSEKIRWLILSHRQEREQGRDYRSNLKRLHHTLNDLGDRIRDLEVQTNMHSDLIPMFLDWQIEIQALITAEQFTGEGGEIELNEFERKVSERIFRLINTMARMGVTKTAPCYDPHVIQNGFQDMLDILELVISINNKENRT